MSLKEKFYKVIGHYTSNSSEITERWNELTEKYTEPFRKYHNFNHLWELFRYFDTYENELEFPNEVAYAIFYHDIIYSIWSKKNELNSAELATEYLLYTDLGDRVITRVFNLIMVTKDHSPTKNRDDKWMIDFDLAILGQPWDVYYKYTQQIREEYASIPDFIYRRGRKKVLNHFLNKNKIYHTDTFYNLFELDARQNLKKELKLL
jgi:predicted metal-dependent HD superfamily phosphohydrolase